MSVTNAGIDPLDRRLLLATQAGLPLVPRPWAQIAAAIGLDEGEVLARMARLKAAGVVRRVAAVPHHYAIGYRANAMTVWDIADDRVDEVGTRVGALDAVSHCYRRPRQLPGWPYNLFAMVHARTRPEAEDQIARVRTVVGAAARASDVLWSMRVLKKTGLRLRGSAAPEAP